MLHSEWCNGEHIELWVHAICPIKLDRCWPSWWTSKSEFSGVSLTVTYREKYRLPNDLYPDERVMLCTTVLYFAILPHVTPIIRNSSASHKITIYYGPVPCIMFVHIRNFHQANYRLEEFIICILSRAFIDASIFNKDIPYDMIQKNFVQYLQSNIGNRKTCHKSH